MRKAFAEQSTLRRSASSRYLWRLIDGPLVLHRLLWRPVTQPHVLFHTSSLPADAIRSASAEAAEAEAMLADMKKKAKAAGKCRRRGDRNICSGGVLHRPRLHDLQRLDTLTF
jgi:hypothetical protein